MRQAAFLLFSILTCACIVTVLGSNVRPLASHVIKRQHQQNARVASVPTPTPNRTPLVRVDTTEMLTGRATRMLTTKAMEEASNMHQTAVIAGSAIGTAALLLVAVGGYLYRQRHKADLGEAEWEHDVA